MLRLAAGRVLAEEVVALPVVRGSDRARHEAAAAVRADVMKHGLDAARAERALVGADARLGRIGRQGLVAMLAGRTELQHQNIVLPFAEALGTSCSTSQCSTILPRSSRRKMSIPAQSRSLSPGHSWWQCRMT